MNQVHVQIVVKQVMQKLQRKALLLHPAEKKGATIKTLSGKIVVYVALLFNQQFYAINAELNHQYLIYSH